MKRVEKLTNNYLTLSKLKETNGELEWKVIYQKLLNLNKMTACLNIPNGLFKEVLVKDDFNFINLNLNFTLKINYMGLGRPRIDSISQLIETPNEN